MGERRVRELDNYVHVDPLYLISIWIVIKVMKLGKDFDRRNWNMENDLEKYLDVV